MVDYTNIEKILIKQKKYSFWRKVVAILAVAVIFFTIYALTFPAITMERTTAHCGMQVHIHEEKCSEQNLICTVDDTTHTHTDECYEIKNKCEIPEHNHTLICYSDSEADVETAEIWEKTIENVTWSGIWEQDIVAIAETQLDYKESENNFIVDEADNAKGYTRYGEWYGNPYGDWNTMFVSFCLYYAGIPDTVMPYESDCEKFVEALNEKGLYIPNGEYTPTAGKLVFLDLNEDEKADFVGIAAEIIPAAETEPESVKIIAGDSEDTVRYEAYALDDTRITGYATLPEQPEEYTASPMLLASEPMALADHVSIDAVGAAGASNSTNVTVKVNKVWEGSGTHPESARVYLYKDGINTGRSVILSSLNNWQAEWTDLQDGEYSIVEDSIADYTSTADYTYSVEGGSDVWIPVSTVTNGKYYAITCPFDSTSVSFDGLLSRQNPTQVNVGKHKILTFPSGTVKVNGVSYTDYLDEVPSMSTFLAENGNFKFGSDYMTIRKSSKECLLGFGQKSSTEGLVTYSAGKLKAVVGDKTYYASDYYIKAVTDKSKAVNFKLYEKTKTDVDKTVKCTLTNTKVENPQTPENSFLLHSKTIDYLNDGTKNPDTDVQAQADLYRLYLDAIINQEYKSKPIDLLFVVDKSYSMDYFGDMTYNINGTTYAGNKRWKAVSVALNGRVNASDTGDAVQQGFIEKFLSNNSQNTCSIVTFAGHPDYGKLTNYTYKKDATTLRDWSRDFSYADIKPPGSAATNYEAGLMEASDQWAKRKDSTNKKIMIFISDGVPTLCLNDRGKQVGTGTEQEANYAIVKPRTLTAIDNFVAKNPDVLINSIGIANFVDKMSDSSSLIGSDDTVLRYMSEGKTGGKFYVSKDSDTLLETINSLIDENLLIKNISIEDKLSSYVNLYGKQPDFKMTITAPDGKVTVLYNNGITTEGMSIINSFSYAASGSSLSSGTVTVKFDPNYIFESKSKYTISYNVEVTDSAYREYFRNGYSGIKGQEGTDYGTNKTSSLKSGFRSNQKATITYDINNTTYTDVYNHPVVQVNKTSSLTIKKVSMDNVNRVLPGAEFELYRAAKEGEAGIMLPGASGKYVKVAESIITGENGMCTVEGLTIGEYWLVETKAPNGYEALTEAQKIGLLLNAVDVNTGSRWVEGSSTDTVVTVKNSSGYILPKTGGIGALPSFAGAAVMMGISSVMLLVGYRNKRHRFERRRI